MGVVSRVQADSLAERLNVLCHASNDPLDKMLKLRQILEQLYKHATEGYNTSFSNLFARMQYANETCSLSKDLQNQSNSLRRYCNQIAHEEVKDSKQEDFDTYANTVYKLISHFCPQFSYPSLVDYFQDKTFKVFTPTKDSEKLSFTAIVSSWQVSDASLTMLVTRDDGKECNILLRNDSKQSNQDGKLFTQLSKSLWRYACIHFHELSVVEGRDCYFQSNPKTLVVLEPDFLVDATAIAECFENQSSNPAYFLLNKLCSEPFTEPILQGSVVNSILDELVFNPELPYQELFRRSLAAQPITFVSQGLQSAMNIYNRVQSDHLPQLTNYLATIKDEDVLLEPSYLCPEYGLQGRIDMLVNKDSKHSVIELKSGKAPAFDVWQSHRMQTVAYNMIIRSVYGADNISFASILYSQSKDNPVRNIPNSTILEQNLLMCRNRIIGIMHQLSIDPNPIISWLLETTLLPESQHMQVKLLRFRNVMEGLRPYEYEWFCAQLMRIVRELWFVKTGDNGTRTENSYGHNSLWQESLAEKKGSYKIITGLVPISYDKKLINFSIGDPEEIADFRQGDIVVLYNQAQKITKQEVLRGVITVLDERQLQVSVRGGLQNNNRLRSAYLWAIEHDNLETALYTPISSLLSFLSAEPHKRDLLLGVKLPEVSKSQFADSEDFETILASMHAAKELYIVQGPPGTGKTSGLLGRYIKDLYLSTSKCLVILSFTNRAVDEICLCLGRQEIPFIRMGSSSIIHEQRLDTIISGKRFEEMQQIIQANRIWVSTVQSANAWFGEMQRIIQVDELIIDEASQIIENSILGIMVKTPKTIMIGDQNQLPPISVQQKEPFSFMEKELGELKYTNYNQSLMERLYKIYAEYPHSCHISMLTRHFRMHKSIAALVESYYGNKLVCATEQQIAELHVNHNVPKFLAHRLVWIDTPPSKLSHVDTLQIDLVTKLIHAMRAHDIIKDPSRELGIVTPFRAMIHALRKELCELDKDISIDTVERFQGSERDIIIMCMPLGCLYDLRSMESLSDDGTIDRKLNVSVSRAKQRLILLGSLDICRNSPQYNNIIKQIAANGVVLDSTQVLSEFECNK